KLAPREQVRGWRRCLQVGVGRAPPRPPQSPPTLRARQEPPHPPGPSVATIKSRMDSFDGLTGNPSFPPFRDKPPELPTERLPRAVEFRGVGARGHEEELVAAGLGRARHRLA